MKHPRALLWLATLPSLGLAADSRPRGVSPEFAKFYNSKDTFACIYNPSITIPITSINDDYCDCPDGSDEPGTSACSSFSHLSPAYPTDATTQDVNKTQALPGFYCKNKGHQGGYVSFEAVNDGVCDYEQCCDGSDEFDHVGGIQCPDKCKEIGKEWRKKDEARQKSMTSALKKRKELVVEAKRRHKEVEERIVSLGTEITGAEMKVKNLEEALAEAEKKDRGRMFRGSGKGGKARVLAGLAKTRIEELRDALIEVKSQRDDLKTRVKTLEDLLTAFKTDYNPNFNDEGVKQAVRAWDDYAVIYQSGGDGQDEEVEQDITEILKPDSETEGINFAEFEAESEDDIDLLYKLEAYLPPSLRSWLSTQYSSLKQILVENGIIASTSSTNPNESQAVTTAKKSLSEAQNRLQELKSSRTEHEGELTKDYGPDGVFRALKGTCISKDSGEYTYELCFLSGTTQKSRKGGGDTNMGTFTSLSTMTVDEDLPPDGKGVGKGERIVMKYENGLGCWNGPQRSTSVVLACSEVDEIWKVVEEEKCVYRMDVGSAAVCAEPAVKPPGGWSDDVHGEL